MHCKAYSKMPHMILTVALFFTLLCVSSAFQRNVASFLRKTCIFADQTVNEDELREERRKTGYLPTFKPDSEAKRGKVHATQLSTRPEGKKFFAADLGIPALVYDYGGGDVGGNDYQDAMFHYGPRGANKPDINEKAVVKLPNLNDPKTYRGHHDFRRPDGTMASEDCTAAFKTTPWTPEEDAKLIEMNGKDANARGRWTRMSVALNRSVADCGFRWNQHLRPPMDLEQYRDILRDNENNENGGNDKRRSGEKWWKEAVVLPV